MAETLPKRIHGTEMEWAASYAVEERPTAGLIPLCNAYLTEAIEEYLADEAIAFSGNPIYAFLQNGARWYNDVGDHREYATPEEDSFLRTAAHEQAGAIMSRAVLDRYEAQQPGVKTFLHKRVIDDNDNTWGYHESYCVNADKVSITQQSLALLGIHMATRNIFFGAGSLDTDGHFWIAQKARDVTEASHLNTTRDKPVINLRDEPLSGPAYRRVHVISGDPNISPWATRVKLGATSLVLRLIEDGQDLSDINICMPLNEAMRCVAKNPKSLLRLANWRFGPASDIQGRLITAATELSKRYPLPDEELWALEEWRRAHQDFEQDMRLLANRADWVLKYQLLEAKHEKNGVAWNSARMRSMEKHYDLTSITQPTVASKYKDVHWDAWAPSDELVDSCMGNQLPPANTRAHIRGRFIKAFWQDENYGVTTWDKVMHNGA
ncbi:MAG TPA: proteasome accessory factor PafA2 family protein, partial [Candidatus Saccharimonadales bacterium]|nr:proteasome accessory factor PafA2 family protein [Candidatus Saccharimonadales bacterium]